MSTLSEFVLSALFLVRICLCPNLFFVMSASDLRPPVRKLCGDICFGVLSPATGTPMSPTAGGEPTPPDPPETGKDRGE